MTRTKYTYINKENSPAENIECKAKSVNNCKTNKQKKTSVELRKKNTVSELEFGYTLQFNILTHEKVTKSIHRV